MSQAIFGRYKKQWVAAAFKPSLSLLVPSPQFLSEILVSKMKAKNGKNHAFSSNYTVKVLDGTSPSRLICPYCGKRWDKSLQIRKRLKNKMFRGRFTYAVDTKGRLSIPSKFREVLSSDFNDERLVVTNFDNCLWAYPVGEWLKIEEKVANLPQFREEVKAFQRFFISAATECPIDKAGRVLLPPTLRDYAGIQRDVVIVGMVRRIEIWAAERWKPVFDDAQAKLMSLGDKLADLGL